MHPGRRTECGHAVGADDADAVAAAALEVSVAVARALAHVVGVGDTDPEAEARLAAGTLREEVRRPRPEAGAGPRQHGRLHAARGHVPQRRPADLRGAQRAPRTGAVPGAGAGPRLHRPGLLRPGPGAAPRAGLARPGRVRRPAHRLPQPRRPATGTQPPTDASGSATPTTSSTPSWRCAARRPCRSTTTGSVCSAGRWAEVSSTTRWSRSPGSWTPPWCSPRSARGPRTTSTAGSATTRAGMRSPTSSCGGTASRPTTPRSGAGSALVRTSTGSPSRCSSTTAPRTRPARSGGAAPTTAALEAAGADVRLRTYPGEEHAFGPDWPLSMRRTVAFFRARL